MSVRLLAYLCGVGALALIAADLFSPFALDRVDIVPSQNRDAWIPAVRPQPAFATPGADFSVRSESYEIVRHAHGGGRKDILRWVGETPLSQLELYRPGTELTAFGPVANEVAARVLRGRKEAVQEAGVIETKFGALPLVRFAGEAGGKPRACMGFAYTFDSPRLQISGWTCQGDNAQSQRRAIGCVLDRLTMLSAGNDPKLADLFAQAELRRFGCRNAAAATDWVTATQEPALRGRI